MQIVVYVAHVDDGILGAGGLIPQLIESGHEVHFVYGTDGSTPREYTTDKRPIAQDALSILGVPEGNIHFLGFEELRFDEEAIIDFNKAFCELDLQPDIFLTTDRTDVNQDHSVVFQSAQVLARSITRQIGLLTCEIVSSSEWSDKEFKPHFYVDIERTIEQKIDAMKQIDEEIREWPHPRSSKGIRIKAQQRGMEVGLTAAESFRVVRWFDWNEPLTEYSVR